MPSAWDLLGTLGPIVGGGIVSRSAAGRASRRLMGGTGIASDQIRTTGQQLRDLYSQVYGHQQSKLQPYEDVGLQNLNTLNQRVNAEQPKFSYSGEDFYKDPGYAFGLQEGQKGITRGANATGTRFSGGTLKALDRYNQDYAGTKYNEGYNRALSTYTTNRATDQDQLNRLRDLAGIGQTATGQDIQAEENMATRTGQAELTTGQQLADLEQQRAEAEAAGDIGRANAITQAIEQGVNAVQGLRTVGQVFGGGAQAAAPAIGQAISGGAALSGTAGTAGILGSLPTAATPSLAAIQAGAVPEIASTSIGVGSLPTSLGGTGGLTAGGASSGGLGSAVAGFLTNPITIGVGAALAGALIWKKSQAHPTANTFVQKFQNPFGDHLGKIVNAFDSALASGKLDKASAQQMRDQVAGFIQSFEQDRKNFAQKGAKERKVAQQAAETMAQYFGPNYEKILGKMQSEIDALPA